LEKGVEICGECRKSDDEEIGHPCLMPLERRKEEESPVGSVTKNLAFW